MSAVRRRTGDGDANSHADGMCPYWCYCGLTYGFVICAIAATGVVVFLVAMAFHLVGFHTHQRAVSAIEVCVIVMTVIWVHVRLSLLPSHVAIGRPLRWRALRRSASRNSTT